MVIAGERVRLEPIDPRLARAMLAGAPHADLGWEDGFPMAPVLDIARTIAASTGTAPPFGAYVIVRSCDGLAVGDAGFHGPPDADGEVEIGYALVPAARGVGLASEAVALLIAWARAQPGVRTITARVEPDNERSERLLARAGFARDGDREGLHRFVLRAGADGLDPRAARTRASRRSP